MGVDAVTGDDGGGERDGLRTLDASGSSAADDGGGDVECAT